jgi:3-methyladenine DNA glycosylase/8-oxoguanine DNA glycosylase
MICEVHGCPAYIAIVPTPSKREPGRGIPAAVFFVFSISSICAQLVKPAAMATITTKLRTDFINPTFLCLEMLGFPTARSVTAQDYAGRRRIRAIVKSVVADDDVVAQRSSTA